MGLLRRGPGLVRTAAVVGTATAVSGRVQHRQQEKYAAQDQAQYEQQVAAEPAPAEAAPAAPDMNTELTQLAQLHQQGILTDEEFAAKKAQILGI
jgi:hypothetical protein